MRAITAERPAGFHGRRKGKPLRPIQKSLFETLFPRLELDLSHPAPQALGALFEVPTEDYGLEIGFGGAEHLVAEALRRPRRGFIGVEPFVNGMAKALVAIDREKLGNIRLYNADAREVLAWLPEASLANIDILYPDPWPKARHNKRRFIAEATVAQFARALRDGGTLRFASDIPDYVEWALAAFAGNADFMSVERDTATPWEGWPGTRYEAKALKAGRVPGYFSFERRARRLRDED